MSGDNGQVRCVPTALPQEPWWRAASATRRLLYVCLYLHADERGVCRASLSQMVDWLTTRTSDLFGRQTKEGPGRQTVKDTLTWLHDQQAVERSVQGVQHVRIVQYVAAVPPADDAPYTGDVPYERICDAYNDAAAIGKRLRQCRALSPDRKAHLRARWQESAFRENYARIFEMAAAGSLATEWRRGLDFDWLTKNGQNYLKVMEGKYADDRVRTDAAGDELDEMIRQAEERRGGPDERSGSG